MKSISLRDIRQGYRGLKRIAQKCVKKGDFDKALKFIDYCVTVASQFNWIYADDELEALLDRIAQERIETGFIGDYEANENHWVFFDDYCTSYVLALQWMRAISKLGKNILYITARTTINNPKYSNILSIIKEIPNVIVEVVPSGSVFQRAESLYRSIIEFKASRLFLHKAMNSLIQLPLCVFPDTLEVYNINLGDQFFWLGTRHIDFNIEFRPFGASVSLQKRNFRKEQLLMVPFYPIDDGNPFEGFPLGCEGKKVIFSGGDYYKTIDKNGTFWHLVKTILDKHKDVVFLFATKRKLEGDDGIAKFVADNHLEGRFFSCDFRKDIYQVFAHCDIYMGTTPISGSLMSQLAAENAKPILQFYPMGTPDDETEQAICYNQRFGISFSSEKEFLKEADLLIEQEDIRKERGEKLKNALLSLSQFEDLVKETLSAKKNSIRIEPYGIDYSFLEKRWLMLEEMGITHAEADMYSKLGKVNCLKYAPVLFLRINCKKIWKKLCC